MDKISLILLAAMLVGLTVMIMPGIFAFNHGKMLRNIALWLAIFTGLALIYRDFGPGSPHPLFSLPPGMVRHEPGMTSTDKSDDDTTSDDKTGAAKPGDDKTDGHQGFTPPGE